MNNAEYTVRRRPLVIGIGQELRGDDAVGRRIAEAFAAAYSDVADGQSVIQLVPELAEPISKAHAIVFVDAREGAEPGSIEIQNLSRESPSATSLTHVSSPEELLLYARGLFGYCPPAAMVTVIGTTFDLGGELSPEVRRAIPTAVQYIRDWLALRGLH